MDYKADVANLVKQFGNKTLGEMEKESGINRYNNTGVGFGYIGLGKLPETREEAMAIFDQSVVKELLKV